MSELQRAGSQRSPDRSTDEDAPLLIASQSGQFLREGAGAKSQAFTHAHQLPVSGGAQAEGANGAAEAGHVSLSIEDGGVPSEASSSTLTRWQAKSTRHAGRVWESGVACVALASLIFSVSALCVKLTGSRVPVFQIVAVRSGLSWLMSLSLALARGIKPIYGQRKHYPILAIRGLIGATAMTLCYEALERLPLADAMTIFFTNPAMTVIAVWLVFGEPITLSSMLGCAASFTGVVLVAQPPFLFGGSAAAPWDHTRLVGTCMGLAAALTSAGAFTAIRSIKKAEPSVTVAMWFHMCATVGSIIPLAFGLPQHAVWPSLYDSACLVAIAVTSFFGQILINRGFQSENAAKVSAINYTQVLYAHVWGILVLGDTETWLGVAGSLLIACGTIGVQAYNLLRPPQPQQAAVTDPKHPTANASVDRRPDVEYSELRDDGMVEIGLESIAEEEANGPVIGIGPADTPSLKAYSGELSPAKHQVRSASPDSVLMGADEALEADEDGSPHYSHDPSMHSEAQRLPPRQT